MANELQYTTSQVTPYLVVAIGRLRYIGVDLAESVIVEADCDELRERASLLKEKRPKFDERYDVLSREKSAAEDHMSFLDGEVGRLS